MWVEGKAGMLLLFNLFSDKLIMVENNFFRRVHFVFSSAYVFFFVSFNMAVGDVRFCSYIYIFF